MSMNRQFTKACKTVVVNTGTVAGTTNINATTVDTQGFNAYRICVLLGTLTSSQVTKLKVQEFTADTAANYADVTGAVTAAAADADGGKLLILDVYKPQQRWIRPVIVRGTANAVITAAWVELYLPDFQPVSLTDATTLSSAVVFDNPA